MTEKETLSCYRCSKVATVYVPSKERVLCNNHFEVFAAAYENLKTSAVAIEDYLVDSIKAELPEKEASDRATGIEFNHRVPVTLITDHLGELATRTEPATCKNCGKPMQLHAQWEPTKQVMGAASKGALDPDFLEHFDEYGNCLDCRTNDGLSRGYYLVDVPMTKEDMIAHLNGHDHQEGPKHRDESPEPHPTESGNVHREEILGSVLANVNKQKAENTNFPIYVDEDGVIWWNKKHKAKNPVIFPIGMSDWNPQFDENGEIVPGTGVTFPSYNWFHSFLDHITGKMRAPNSCGTCEGTGHHPELYDEQDVAAHFEEARIKQQRAQQRELKVKPVKTKSAHSGPGIKPHDHHNKKRHYAPRKTGPLGRTGAGTIPMIKGKGSAFKTPSFDMMRLPPFEKIIYDQMNMFHDITHTEYKTPSYMYRNPNPMYYSPGSRRNWGDSKPWRN